MFDFMGYVWSFLKIMGFIVCYFIDTSVILVDIL